MRKWFFIGIILYSLVGCNLLKQEIDYSQVLQEITVNANDNPSFLSLQVSSASEENVVNTITKSNFFHREAWECRNVNHEGVYKDFYLYYCIDMDNGLSAGWCNIDSVN